MVYHALSTFDSCTAVDVFVCWFVFEAEKCYNQLIKIMSFRLKHKTALKKNFKMSNIVFFP